MKPLATSVERYRPSNAPRTSARPSALSTDSSRRSGSWVTPGSARIRKDTRGPDATVVTAWTAGPMTSVAVTDALSATRPYQ